MFHLDLNPVIPPAKAASGVYVCVLWFFFPLTLSFFILFLAFFDSLCQTTLAHYEHMRHTPTYPFFFFFFGPVPTWF